MILGSSRAQASILPNHCSRSSSSTMDVDYGGYYEGHHSRSSYNNHNPKNNTSRSHHIHIYSPHKKVNNPYSSYSDDSFADVLRVLCTKMRKTSSWLAMGLAFFVVLTVYYHRQFNWILEELQIDSLSQLVSSYQQLQSNALWKEAPVDQVQRLEKEKMKLQKEKQELKFQYESKARNDYHEWKAEESRMSQREEAWKSQVKLLQKATIRESRRAVIDKFGNGPYYVEFTFVLPDDGEEVERTFTVETAPLDLMPHSVHLFLEQVSHELWDRAWFYLNGPHVLQAGPMLDEDEYQHLTDEEWENLDDRAAVLKPFTEKDLDSLAFPEYSDEFKHEAWTLGFAGRPGGPDWYINKVDNTKSHGPGGQYQHDLEEQADSCFAKVVSGFDDIKLIFNEATIEEGDEWEYFLMEPTYIVQARIVDRPGHLPTQNRNSTNTTHHFDHSQLHHKMHKMHIDHQVEA